ncbi:hypothetical protein MNR01_06455 [Lysobacter sp. S4-A87]|uniref:hypothetical protein n=1 Tax=Lysobacter sp. S4-A87 TaxID=2925843 RepID=UPI001F52EA94|nr:hypothetical protein [Lysobacter sp. S4-A87]UNK50642.1 hypothetical protein MNR01_06455 [Lysobacter sp. S4-A87]
MKVIEILALFGAGYVSGLSVSSGFIFQAIRKFNRSAWSSAKEVLWIAGACANMIIGGLTPILLMGFVVVGDQPGRPDLWPRMLLFGSGVVLGGALVFFGVWQLNKGVSSVVGNGA